MPLILYPEYLLIFNLFHWSELSFNEKESTKYSLLSKCNLLPKDFDEKDLELFVMDIMIRFKTRYDDYGEVLVVNLYNRYNFNETFYVNDNFISHAYKNLGVLYLLFGLFFLFFVILISNLKVWQYF